MMPWVLALCLIAAPRPKPANKPVEKAAEKPIAAEVTKVVPQFMPKEAAAAGTKCAACHTTGDWLRVTFAHDRTGFPLRDAHTKVDCRSCHTQGFQAPLGHTCSSCHRDPHTGEFGQLCESCHTSAEWQARFTVDAHRGTLFPLSGAHAALPCQECHAQIRDRIFARTPTMCSSCHLKDYVATGATSVDHTAAGFPQSCQDCHSTQRFTPANFAAHDVCFTVRGTAHAALNCRNCHTSLTGASVSGACATHTAACSNCHTHECAKTDPIHVSVPGYQCKDQKCYECHRFTRGAR